MVFRQLLFLVPTVALTAFSATLAFTQMAAYGGFTAVDAVLLLLLTLSTGYVTSQSWQVVLGSAHRLVRRLRRRAAALDARDPAGPDFRRLAVVMPVCDEDVAAVFGAIEVIRRSMGAAGLAEAEVFVLSDSRDGETACDERSAFAAALARSPAGPAMPALRYRHRAENHRRKAGNIAEFCEAHSERFDLMLVLDADSLMTGAAIRGLAELMAAEPRLGLVQTLCFPARRLTLFARIQQFAARLYAPLHTAGMTFWTGADGIYWGHNAMIRMAPFRAFCELPVLPGRPPLGGEVLCHDVVEAAFLRRAGWEIRILPGLPGTWEDMPSNTIDFAVRDRRWCQGNLQHRGLLGERGLTWPFRYHMLIGIFSYVSAPIWLAFLGLGTIQVWFGTDRGAGAGDTLLAPAVAAPVLFWTSLALIFLPKVLSIAFALADARARRGFGGGVRLCVSAVLETAFGLLWSQISLLFYSAFVLSTLAGRTVSWDPQSRGDRGVTWREAMRRHRLHVAIGIGWGLAVAALDPAIFWWMSPFFVGLILSPAITVLSSRADIGRASRRLGLFLTPDETDPAPELAALPLEIERVAAGLRTATAAQGGSRERAAPAPVAGLWPVGPQAADAAR